MKNILFISLMLGFLVGCTTNTPYVDWEFGKASRMAFDKQVADKTYQHADQVPEGIAGLTAEQVMKVYTDDFGEKPQEMKINVLAPGVAK
jgi:hypothetical protein